MPARTAQTATDEDKRIRPELADLVVPIRKVKVHPKNARLHDLDAIKASLTTHGQYVPILVQRRTGRVVKGNGTLLAARALGWSEIAVQYLDLDDRQALTILAADNKASDQSGYDEEDLAALLSELARTGDLEAALFTQHDLDEVLASLDRSAQVERSMGSLGALPETGGRNPMEGEAPEPDDPSVPLVFYLLPDERDEVRAALAETGEASISDQLLAVVRAWRSAS